MNIFDKTVKALEEGGIGLLLQRVFNKSHNLMRPFLPRRVYTKGCVRFQGRMLDYLNTDKQVSGSDMKWEARHSVEKYVESSDVARVVGSGEGVTATHLADACRYVGIFEPSVEMIEKTRETLKLNGFSEDTDFTIVPRLFGDSPPEDSEIWGELHPRARQVDGSYFSRSIDVLELDCEGAELSILRSLEARPRVLIVEVHECFGVSFCEVVDVVKSMGYEIELVYPQDMGSGTVNFVATLEVSRPDGF